MSLSRSQLLLLAAAFCQLLFPSPGLAGSDPAPLDLVRTWKSVVDPLAFPPDQTLIGVGFRRTLIGITLRVEGLYNLNQNRDRYALGSSAGISW
jgi:hypothetical protein